MYLRIDYRVVCFSSHNSNNTEMTEIENTKMVAYLVVSYLIHISTELYIFVPNTTNVLVCDYK